MWPVFLFLAIRSVKFFSSRFSVRATEREWWGKALAVSSKIWWNFPTHRRLLSVRDVIRWEKEHNVLAQMKMKSIFHRRKFREREHESEWVCLLIKYWKERRTIVKVQREKCLRHHQSIVRRPYHCWGFHTREKKSMTNNKSWPNFFKFQPTQFPASVPFILSKLNFYDEIKNREMNFLGSLNPWDSVVRRKGSRLKTPAIIVKSWRNETIMQI